MKFFCTQIEKGIREEKNEWNEWNSDEWYYGYELLAEDLGYDVEI